MTHAGETQTGIQITLTPTAVDEVNSSEEMQGCEV